MKLAENIQSRLDQIKSMYKEMGDKYSVPTDEEILEYALEDFFKSVRGLYYQETGKNWKSK